MSRTPAANLAGLKQRYPLWSFCTVGDYLEACREGNYRYARTADQLEGKIIEYDGANNKGGIRTDAHSPDAGR